MSMFQRIQELSVEPQRGEIEVILRDVFELDGMKYYTVLLFSSGRIDGHGGGFEIRTATFTGLSKSTGILYIRGKFHKTTGNVGVTMCEKDYRLLMDIVNDYHSRIGISQIDPNHQPDRLSEDKQWEDMFKI